MLLPSARGGENPSKMASPTQLESQNMSRNPGAIPLLAPTRRREGIPLYYRRRQTESIHTQKAKKSYIMWISGRQQWASPPPQTLYVKIVASMKGRRREKAKRSVGPKMGSGKRERGEPHLTLSTNTRPLPQFVLARQAISYMYATWHQGPRWTHGHLAKETQAWVAYWPDLRI